MKKIIKTLIIIAGIVYISTISTANIIPLNATIINDTSDFYLEERTLIENWMLNEDWLNNEDDKNKLECWMFDDKYLNLSIKKVSL